ncbi:NF038104 family lipoprotein [Hydrogenophaga atypica]|uniref:NF038104 family lipoprotein n=1 Tax=Hydrogenophaga atypica TaxID=249409 RepID=A0ABW2QQL5_9BURK
MPLARPAQSSFKRPWVLCLLAGMALQGCAVIAVADAAVTVVATGVKVTAKAVGAVADAVIPDGDDKPED